MRTLVDIPDHQIDALAELGLRLGSSRAALVREAITAFLKANAGPKGDAFGIWRDAGVAEDGVVYQDRIRAEW